MSLLGDLVYGIRRVIFGGEDLPTRGELEFTGAGVTVEDIDGRIVVTITGGVGGLVPPIDATYVTVSDNAPPLTGSRQLTSSSSVDISDTGAGSPIILSVKALGVVTAMLAAKAVTFVKMQDVAALSVIANATNATGALSAVAIAANEIVMELGGAIVSAKLQNANVHTSAAIQNAKLYFDSVLNLLHPQKNWGATGQVHEEMFEHTTTSGTSWSLDLGTLSDPAATRYDVEIIGKILGDAAVAWKLRATWARNGSSPFVVESPAVVDSGSTGSTGTSAALALVSNNAAINFTMPEATTINWLITVRRMTLIDPE